jgi:hypothetical protein
MDDESFQRFYARMQAIHLANGFEDAKEGNCPALVAEDTQSKAEAALIKAAEEFFPGVTNDRLLCSTVEGNGLKTRKKYLDLLIRMAVNHPGYKAPSPLPATRAEVEREVAPGE